MPGDEGFAKNLLLVTYLHCAGRPIFVSFPALGSRSNRGVGRRIPIKSGNPS